MHFDISAITNQDLPQVAAFGIYVASHEALDQTAVYDPNADEGADWYYWTSRVVGVRSDNLQTTTSWDVDIRSQRRLRGDYVLLLVAAGNVTNGIAIDTNISMRFLWSQP